VTEVADILQRIFDRESELRAARALVRDLEEANLKDVEELKKEMSA
jgi:hypothetical protein